jgi:hypothetical protein
MFRRSFLLRNRAEHIARARNMREVNLGLDFFFAVGSPRSSLG